MEENLGYLLEKDISLSEKIEACEKVIHEMLTNNPVFLPQAGKAVCWLTYRFMEGSYSDVVLLRLAFENVFQYVSKEENQFHHYRWHCSLITARTYFMLQTGQETKPKILDGSSLTINPFTMVNISRLFILRAFWGIANNNITESQNAITKLYAMYPRFVAMLELTNQPACIGYEIEMVARMVRMAIMLMPHCEMKYKGDVYPLDEIAITDPTQPFKSIIKKIIKKDVDINQN